MDKYVIMPQERYELMKTMVEQDGMIITRLEVELEQAKEDIKRLLVLGGISACEFCKGKPPMCECCENEAEWRGYRSDAKA